VKYVCQLEYVATLDAVKERLIAICDRFDAATVSAVDALDRRCSYIRELESRLCLAAQRGEKVSSSLLDREPERRLVKLIRRMCNTIMAVLPYHHEHASPCRISTD
jgi:uncharacterized protein (UPF0262 family)